MKMTRSGLRTSAQPRRSNEEEEARALAGAPGEEDEELPTTSQIISKAAAIP
jgi:hypothetical protein